ncbi:hypothetical protein L1887_45647 [Cichorium endivia]|nr:hypothetical protein L1887_45647 [Cichorium endivia]
MRNFIVVAEELHMHRAAERLNMAQPALSQQIKALEERLGVTLFSRANRRLTLTPGGEAFLVKARLAISLTEQAVLDARQTARGEQGVLNLGCVSSAMFDGRLPAALRQMHTRWPAITMSLVTGNVQTLYAAVQSNQLDVAIIRAPLPSLPDDLQSRPFTSEKTVLALYRQHPLAGSSALTLSSRGGLSAGRGAKRDRRAHGDKSGLGGVWAGAAARVGKGGERRKCGLRGHPRPAPGKRADAGLPPDYPIRSA